MHHGRVSTKARSRLLALQALVLTLDEECTLFAIDPLRYRMRSWYVSYYNKRHPKHDGATLPKRRLVPAVEGSGGLVEGGGDM